MEKLEQEQFAKIFAELAKMNENIMEVLKRTEQQETRIKDLEEKVDSLVKKTRRRGVEEARRHGEREREGECKRHGHLRGIGMDGKEKEEHHCLWSERRRE